MRSPTLTGKRFQRFLELLSADIKEDIAVIQFDQGSFHRVKAHEAPRKYYPYFSTTTLAGTQPN